MNNNPTDIIYLGGKPVDALRVIVNAGALSADNGANGPLSLFFELAKALGTEPEVGEGYGRDCLLVPVSDWSTAQAMLDESKLLYRLAGADQPWQNVRNDAVRQRLNPTFQG